MFITRFDDTRLYIVYLRLVSFLYVHNADLSIGVHFRCRNTVQYSALTVTLNKISYIINECNAVMCNCLLCCGDTNRQSRVCVCWLRSRKKNHFIWIGCATNWMPRRCDIVHWFSNVCSCDGNLCAVAIGGFGPTERHPALEQQECTV